MTIKRLLTLAALLLMLFTLPALAEEYTQVAAAGPDGLQFATGDQGVWILENDSVTYLPEEGESCHIANVTGATRIAGSVNTVYVLADKGDKQLLLGYNLKGEEVFRAALPDNLFIQQFEVRDTIMLFLARPEDPASDTFLQDFSVYWGRSNHLVGNSLKLTTLQVRGWENGHISAMALKGNVLYTYDIQSSVIAAINWREFTLVARRQYLSTPVRYLQAAPTKDGTYAVYFLDDRRLSYANLSTGDFSTLLFDLPTGCTGLRATGKHLYTRGAGIRSLLRLNLPNETDKANELVLLVDLYQFQNSNRLTEATRLFNQKYPDMKVVLLNINDVNTTMSDLRYGLVDVVNTNALEYNDTVAAVANGLVLDLSLEESITQLMPLYRDVFSACTLDGSLYCIPTAIEPTMIQVNQALCDQTGIQPHAFWDWPYMAKQAKKLQAYNEEHGTHYCLLKDNPDYPLVLDQLHVMALNPITGTANYLQKGMTETLDAWREIVNAGMVADSRSIGGHSQDKVLFTVSSVYGLPDIGKNTYLLAPAVSGDTPCVATVQGLMVNARSPRREEAVHFLTCYLSAEALAKEKVYESAYYLAAADERRQDVYDRYTTRSNQQQLFKALEAAKSDSMPYQMRNQVAETHLPRFLAGEISAPELAVILQESAETFLRQD